jgi:hypothetical protein
MKNLKTVAILLALLVLLAWTVAPALAQASPAGSTVANNTAGTGGSGGNTGPSGASNTGPTGVSNTGPAGASGTGPAGVSNTGPSGVSNTGPSGGVAPTISSGQGNVPSGSGTYASPTAKR